MITQDLQIRLDDHFLELKDSREGPIFFIEHELDSLKLEELFEIIKSELKIRSFKDYWWIENKLLIIVAATEIGYTYEGSGTDFWPKFNDKLDIKFNYESRTILKEFFEKSSIKYNSISPANTKWNNYFNIISWPITNSLLPIEFQRYFSNLLKNINLHSASSSDTDLYNSIKVIADRPSTRFLSFLKKEEVIVPLCRSLIENNKNYLSINIIDRIKNDLEKDNLARKNINIAKRIQNKIKNGIPDKRSVSFKNVEEINGIIRLNNNINLSLEVCFPTIDLSDDKFTKLRNYLRRRNFKPKLWDSTEPINTELLFSRNWFEIILNKYPKSDSTLFPDDITYNIDFSDELSKAFYSFSLSLKNIMLFVESKDNSGIANQIKSKNISGRNKYYLLVNLDELSPSLKEQPHLGNIGPFQCFFIDPENEHANYALKRLGFNVKFGISVDIQGVPSLLPNQEIPVFNEGDIRIITVNENYLDGIKINYKDQSLTMHDSSQIVSFGVSLGENKLKISNDSDEKEFHFKGINNDNNQYNNIIDLKPISSEITIQELLSKRLSFQIDSFYPLQGLKIIIELQFGLNTFSAMAYLNSIIPHKINCYEPPLSYLFEKNNNNNIIDSLQNYNSCIFTIFIGNLIKKSWTLEQSIKPCWWSFNDGHHTLQNENGEIEYGIITETTPHLAPINKHDSNNGELKLLAPTNNIGSNLDPLSFFTTLCLSKNQTSWEGPVINKPKLVRSIVSPSNESVGLLNLCEAYFRWVLSDSYSLIADFRKRNVITHIENWIIELCCGDEWSKRELELQSSDPWVLLEKYFDTYGIGRDQYLVEEEGLPIEINCEVTPLIIKAIQNEFPDLWNVMVKNKKVVFDQFQRLDDLCNESYELLANDYKNRGQNSIYEILINADVGIDPDVWINAFKYILNKIKPNYEKHVLASLVTPTNTVNDLIKLQSLSLNLDELTYEISQWAKQSKRVFLGDVPSDDLIKVSLAIWTDPWTAITLDWKSSLLMLLSDRSFSRVIRYISLRHRQSSSIILR